MKEVSNESAGWLSKGRAFQVEGPARWQIRRISVRKGIQRRWKSHHSCRVKAIIDMNQPWVYMCSPSWTPLPTPSPAHPSGSSQCMALSTLSHALNLDWQSVSHMIIYIFQCYSLKSSHPCLLPQSPRDCSIHLCLFCCLTYRVIITIFLNSIYMH